MKRVGRTGFLTAFAAAGLAAHGTCGVEAQSPVVYRAQPSAGPVTADRLVRMTETQLDQLYQSMGPGVQPRGKVRGIAIVSPGSKFGPAMSKGAKFVWQGKFFNEDGQSAVNRFFGVKAVRGNLYYGPSWVDGRTSLILDYKDTSLVYGRYRDEIRQVGPNLYLGVMHTRAEPVPMFTRYFAFETNP
jgi:hypothetical protein